MSNNNNPQPLEEQVREALCKNMLDAIAFNTASTTGFSSADRIHQLAQAYEAMFGKYTSDYDVPQSEPQEFSQAVGEVNPNLYNPPSNYPSPYGPR